MKLIVIGGVAAGMSAASKLKRVNPEAEITVYEKGDYVSYGACGLPYYVSGENNDHTKMIARTKEEFRDRGIDVRTRHEVVKVAPERKQVMIRNYESGQLFIDHYDKLMIATGTMPIVPPFDGLELGNIHVLKTMEDGILLKEKINKPHINNVVIVGGGYIGIELAEAMHTLGKNVRIIEQADRILTPFDPEITEIATKHLQEKQVALHLNESVKGFSGDKYVQKVMTDKSSYDADLVIVSIGVKPATQFLQGTDIQLAGNGAIVIDREMRTTVEDIYAAGDCAEVYHYVKQENAYLPLGTNANKCGRIAGENIAGSHQKYIGTLGSAAVKIIDLELARTGLSEQEAKDLAIDYTTEFVKAANHPGYYPGQKPLWIKIICEKRTKRILGAQAIGESGAVLRIDMFAIAIQNNMPADELGMTDLCYAPPFAGVWDAVHIASNAVK
ncbi:NADPH-dependent 2,4-dienoyl-CoA reductase, sulfur reductase [Gracilibacillus ureilyticus]|uniref:NADPH-dependent 2,4-dienoyl-CoA reductase, sulfur reductase n=1 Tax=Gracilibacillus ureilyticus TaxID=531814 RepID=A0A1H9NZQ4_9BACI|nr:CoA-disulfide reductase [Gracilibacillus ureilyticus]SER41456.1 NADPH-dependent 2,4-dienoyl-CoA reductase, sulfur reductase [Gracilibacillus ureilyticus]